MIVYVLYYDDEASEGAREFWNVSYTPMEIFDTKEAREARIYYLQSISPTFCFETSDLEIMTLANAKDEFGL